MWRRRNEGVNHLASVKEILRRERPPQRVRQPFSAGGLGPSRTSLEGPQDDLARFREWNRPVKLERDARGDLERHVTQGLDFPEPLRQVVADDGRRVPHGGGQRP